MQIKQNAGFRAPVRLLNSSGAPVTNVAFNQVTIYIQKQASSAAQKTISTFEWWELDATNMPGIYDFYLSPSDTNIVGFLKYYVSQATSSYFGMLEVVAYSSADIYSAVQGGGGGGGTGLPADAYGYITGTYNFLGRSYDPIAYPNQDTNLDLSPVLKILGKPIVSVSDDVRQIGRVVQDIQTKVDDIL